MVKWGRLLVVVMLLLWVSCNKTEKTTMNTIDSNSWQKMVQFIISKNNEVLMLVRADESKTVFNTLYILQTENNYSDVLDGKSFSAAIMEDDNCVILKDIEKEQVYVLSVKDESDRYSDYYYYGYGLAKLEGEFPLNLFIEDSFSSAYEVIHHLNIDLLEKGQIVPLSNDIGTNSEYSPCGASGCSISWKAGSLSHSCSVVCGEGYGATCNPVMGCYCEKCNAGGGEDPSGGGGGSSN